MWGSALKTLNRKQNINTLVFGRSLSEYKPFSNWGKFPVKYNGITFPTLEHAEMHEKCLVNNDVNAARAALESHEPHQIGERLVEGSRSQTHGIKQNINLR